MKPSLLICLLMAAPLFTVSTAIAADAPVEPGSTLAQARQDAWAGNTDRAVAAYKTHLQQHPDDQAAWLELIKAEGWRGNYPDALDQLAQYRARFGEDRPYLEQRARALAWLGKTEPALAISEKLLADTPRDVDVLTTQAIALQAANRPREALATLQTIRELRPDATDTADLFRYLNTPQRSSITLAGHYSKDSDDVHIGRASLEAEYVLSPETRLQAGIEGQRLTAKTGDGLENINGDSDANDQSVWVGGVHRFSPWLAADLRAGGVSASENHELASYRAGLDIRPSDEWWLRPELERNIFAVSPRTVSLGIRRDSARLLARWSPDSRYVIDATSSYDNLSDGNQRWELSLAPRRALWRTQRVNIDLGLSARWFGYQDDLANGYYDPQRYQHYALTAFSYWKFNDNNGLSLALSAGLYKDDSMSAFKAGGDLVAQGYFGIFDDWYLRIYTSLLSNVRQSSGAYRGAAAGAALTRRF